MTMTLAGRLDIPADAEALLFDMDGVLIDSLAQDYALAGELLGPYAEPGARIDPEVIRRWFALALDDFWVKVAADCGVSLPPGALHDIVERHERLRRETAPTVHDGIIDVLAAAGTAGLDRAVVSNNPQSEVERILAGGGLLASFDTVVGNDEPGLRRKPAPDPYLAAARRLGRPPQRCVAIEDSVLGLESAHSAGCHVIGVATGADTYAALAASGYADRCYPTFATAVTPA
jgi:HAD superfamily hydrolase (TIGR01509 family)